jgi:hypothetical protein
MPTTAERVTENFSTWSSHIPGGVSDSEAFQSVKEFKAFPEHIIFDKRQVQQSKKLMMLDPDFDTARAYKIQEITDPEKRQKEKDLFSMEIRLNWETMLAERLHAGMSRIEYRIENGLIYGLGSSEPSIAIFKRGAEYTKQHGASPSDQLRETAEVETFENKIQKLFADEKTPIGTMLFVVSAPGKKGETRYGHNFIDGWQTVIKNGEKRLVLTRYSNGLDLPKTIEQMKAINPRYEVPEQVTDEWLLRHPLQVSPTEHRETTDALQTVLQQGEFMGVEEFAKVTDGCRALIDEYNTYVLEHPEDVFGRNRIANAIINMADAIVSGEDISYRSVEEHIADFGDRPVREVSGWCGLSEGFATGTGAFSVADFGGALEKIAGSDEYGALAYVCGKCTRVGVRTRGVPKEPCKNCKEAMC